MNYLKALHKDRNEAITYYKRDFDVKSEQQKFLEKLLLSSKVAPETIIDVGCGGGGTAYHLSKIYPDSKFTLVDYNNDALNIAREVSKTFNAQCLRHDIYHLTSRQEKYSLVLCLQTLSWLEKPDTALRELIGCCAEKGKIIISALFNDRHDVDIESRIIDHTRPSAKAGLIMTYRTFSLARLSEKIKADVKTIKYHSFNINVDLPERPAGLGTYTEQLINGSRIQISGGVLMNWGFLEIEK